MGVSTDAILFYGYCWDEETPWEFNVDKWQIHYAHANGCPSPSSPYPERTAPRTRENNYDSTPKDYSTAEQAIIDQHTAYWEAKNRLVGESPCLIDTHCSASCPMPYVAVKASRTTSHRGCPREITSLTVDPAWDDQLSTFCATLEIETKDMKAAWWLVSDWSE